MSQAETGRATQPILDETGRPIGAAGGAARLLDETGQPVGGAAAASIPDQAGQVPPRREALPGVFSQVGSTLRAHPWAGLLFGVILGYALGHRRRER
ncbi:conserved protein of unknown function [Rhodovastum atsumiense]|uniref:Uncharacterized protein n=1 Tax=Rhodovastum atsumiense TaxID=504468 RepID=A0A5M6ISP2_9PROT|nr:hypothetical protein [Rhodovastum atsumiense]KAA5611344.1 hypothetical protein F1189_14480 [Rhodovastum atsumiense]CAH2603667.1 conserved protein of unknown function [Rhodovastum atsumiense]